MEARPIPHTAGVSQDALTGPAIYVILWPALCPDSKITERSYPGTSLHDDVIKWKHFLRYWSFVRGIHRSPVKSPHKGQWRGALMFSLISDWINGWVNNRETGDLKRHLDHYDVTVMSMNPLPWNAAELCTAVHKESQNSTQASIQQLVRSMPRPRFVASMNWTC